MRLKDDDKICVMHSNRDNIEVKINDRSDNFFCVGNINET